MAADRAFADSARKIGDRTIQIVLIVGMDQILRTRPDEDLRLITDERARGRRHEEVAACRIELHDHVRRMIGDEAETSLAACDGLVNLDEQVLARATTLQFLQQGEQPR